MDAGVQPSVKMGDSRCAGFSVAGAWLLAPGLGGDACRADSAPPDQPSRHDLEAETPRHTANPAGGAVAPVLARSRPFAPVCATHRHLGLHGLLKSKWCGMVPVHGAASTPINVHFSSR